MDHTRIVPPGPERPRGWMPLHPASSLPGWLAQRGKPERRSGHEKAPRAIVWRGDLRGQVRPPDYVEPVTNPPAFTHHTAIEVVPLQTGGVATRPAPIGKLEQRWFVGPQDNRPEAWVQDDAGWAQRAWEAQALRVEQALLKAAG